MSESIGYVVGNNGNILKTTNGGAAWEFQSVPVTEDWVAVDFFNPTNGVAISANKIISTNGTAWSVVGDGATNTMLQNYTLKGLTYYDANTVYLAGANASNEGAVFELNLTNGTVTEQVISDGPLASLNAITTVRTASSIEVGIVVAVGDDASFVQFNSSRTEPWQKISNLDNNILGSGVDLKDVQFVDKYKGYAVGENGEVLQSLTAGLSWTDFGGHIDPNNTDIVHIDFTNETNGVVVYPNKIEAIEDLGARFSARFWYDELGRIVLSQNTKTVRKTVSLVFLSTHTLFTMS